MSSQSAIITAVPPADEPAGPWPAGVWQRELARALSDLGELLRLLEVAPGAVDASPDPFPLRVPRPYVARMRRRDPHDPLLRQVLPTTAERLPVAGFSTDPLQERAAAVAPSLLRKYAGRALVIATGACAVHCRYCFRRHFPYARHRQSANFDAVERIRADPGIREVILSGGDPLTLTDAHFARLTARIGALPHVARLRLHTRLPVVIPQRVTSALVDALAAVPQQVVVVLHFNHPNEIDADCRRALAALRGFVLLNQSVLLAGVNDAPAMLAALSERLFEAGVLPYYLHLPDAVAGTAHFGVSEARAISIHRQLAAALPGYLVPKLVREVAGAAAKECLATGPIPPAA